MAYSLVGRDLALKVARNLFRNKIKKTLKGNSYLDIGALVKANLPVINEKLNRKLTKGVYSAGKTNDIRVIGLLAKDNSMQVQVYVSAEVEVMSDGVF